MNSKFDLQFFGGGGPDVQQVRKRDSMPEGLKNLRDTLYEKISPGVQSFDPTAWSRAQDISNNAMGQMNGLINQIPNSLNQSNKFLTGLSDTLTTGNIPTGITDKLNAGVNKSHELRLYVHILSRNICCIPSMSSQILLL